MLREVTVLGHNSEAGRARPEKSEIPICAWSAQISPVSPIAEIKSRLASCVAPWDDTVRVDSPAFVLWAHKSAGAVGVLWASTDKPLLTFSADCMVWRSQSDVARSVCTEREEWFINSIDTGALVFTWPELTAGEREIERVRAVEDCLRLAGLLYQSGYTRVVPGRALPLQPVSVLVILTSEGWDSWRSRDASQPHHGRFAWRHLTPREVREWCKAAMGYVPWILATTTEKSITQARMSAPTQVPRPPTPGRLGVGRGQTQSEARGHPAGSGRTSPGMTARTQSHHPSTAPVNRGLEGVPPVPTSQNSRSGSPGAATTASTGTGDPVASAVLGSPRAGSGTSSPAGL
jgi:hypothetical protein